MVTIPPIEMVMTGGWLVYGIVLPTLEFTPIVDDQNHIHFPIQIPFLTTTSLQIMVSKGNHPQMALFQVSELL